MTRFLENCGFKRSVTDVSLFIYHHHTSPIYLIVYVNNIVLTGPSTDFLDNFVKQLAFRFTLKDLGTLSYFLGVEVVPTKHGLFLSQKKYITDLLERTKMLGANSVPTPMLANSTLSLHSGQLIDNPTDYRTAVSGHQYLTLTRPDVVFAVNKLSQYMHQPRTAHRAALKRLLRYLSGTLDQGITIYKDSPLNLHDFSDADWQEIKMIIPRR